MENARSRILRAFAPLLLALDVTLLVAAERSTDLGRRVEWALMYDFDTKPGTVWLRGSQGLSHLVPLTVATGMILVAACLVLSLRTRALAALVILLGSTATTTLTKGALEWVLGEHATMPSGHSTMAMSCALAWLFLLPAVMRRDALVMAGMLAAFGPVAVVVLTWHEPGDVVATMAVVACWAAVTAGLMPVLRPWAARLPGIPDEWFSRWVPNGQAQRRARPQGFAESLPWVLAGSLITAVAFFVLGLRPQAPTPLRDVVEVGMVFLIACGAACVVAFGARVLRGAEEPTH